jgi:hypothetical protein
MRPIPARHDLIWPFELNDVTESNHVRQEHIDDILRIESPYVIAKIVRVAKRPAMPVAPVLVDLFTDNFIIKVVRRLVHGDGKSKARSAPPRSDAIWSLLPRASQQQRRVASKFRRNAQEVCLSIW